ncbi:LCP family protein [Lacticaseibacillus camelliae]|uniref:Transcriptional regulator n=1 Tax=Lacticaseibacillus camelliae DSM 22697 = JCM 13995 TaxID=1423730 RepID=A0A0R2FEM4_9LACO|nr:LCP family protein [Lacticaseibacillus camelliae]KRN25835.1 Transcriptional regulator [Lacticaseibacillus camelliae DSM 22697 = JCM 13995]
MDRRDSRSQHHRHPLAKVIVLLALTVVFLAGGYALRLYAQTKNALDTTYDNHTAKKTHVDLSKQKPFSVLLLGTDTGGLGRSDKGRTDTMILVTVNPQKKRTTMVSIPRDTMSHVASSDYTGVTKINSAYTYGGTKLAQATVKDLINVPINYYALVNLDGLEKIVDAVGGVDVNVAFSWTDPHVGSYKFTKGKMHLDGKAALAYARMRHEDPEGDYGRQKRQQEVIEQVVKKVLSAKSLSRYSSLMQTLSSDLRTNLSFDELVTLATNYRGAFTDVREDSLKGDGAYIGAAAYQVPSTTELQRISDLARAELGLSKTPLDNYNTKQNQLNTNAGFNWEDGSNPAYHVYQDLP